MSVPKSQAGQIYHEKKFNLSGLNGISDKQLQEHFGLYSGYVKNTNLLNEHITDLVKKNKIGTPEYSELKRRLGFEYNGMRLHEFYFANLTSNAKELSKGTDLHALIERYFGSYEDWKKDFVGVGTMRGVGWAILYQDPFNGYLSNHWITLHEEGHPAGFQPILVMDVWEHAFMVDYQASERSKYIEAFFSNINWEHVEQRLVKQLSAGK